MEGAVGKPMNSPYLFLQVLWKRFSLSLRLGPSARPWSFSELPSPAGCTQPVVTLVS